MSAERLVAVTGADGFIGSHLVEALVRRGQAVRAMVQYNSIGSWGWLDTLPAEIMGSVEVRLGDVRDPASVASLVNGASVVYHLAALIAIPFSYEAPRSYFDTNLMGTLHVLEAARAHDVERVVHTSTSEVYGTARSVPITEEHPLQAQSPYAASKIAADKAAESYHLSFDLPCVTLRPFNTFGPRQSARAVIPTVISQLAAGRDRLELGALDPTRDFLYVGDTAEAFIAVGEAPAAAVTGRTFNAGTGVERSVGEVAQMIAKMMDRDLDLVMDERRLRPSNSEVMRLVADATRLRMSTDWAPSHAFEDGLERCISWFRDAENLARYRVGTYAR